MRYRDLFRSQPDHTVLLHIRRGEMQRLEALVMRMDIRLYGPIRRMPTGNAFVEVTCRDAATASALLAAWGL